MTRIILDTSVYSAAGRGDTRFKKWLKPEVEILLPLPVIAELRAGFLVGNRPDKNERDLQRFLVEPNVSVATISDATTQYYAEIYAQLRRAGKPIGTNDMWIAALALEQGIPLLTLDTDFSNIPDLQLVKL